MHRRITQSIFFKLIISFAITISISLVTVIVFSTQFLNQRELNSIEAESIRAINTIENYTNTKYTVAKQAIASMYNMEYYTFIPEFLSSPTNSLVERQEFSSVLDSFFQLYFTSDNDIKCIALESTANDAFYVQHRENIHYRDLQAHYSSRTQYAQDALPRFGFTILPIGETADDDVYSTSSLSLICKIKAVGMLQDVGYLIMDFSTNSLKSKLSDFSRAYPYASLYLLSSDNTVLFDSSNELTGQYYTEFDQYKTTIASFQKTTSQDYVLVEYNENLDLYYLVVVPLAESYEAVKVEKNIVYFGVLALILFSLLCMITICAQYYRRISTICSAINVIQSGNLDTRITTNGKNDELTLIANNLNEMCDMLSEHIQKVYISQINVQTNELLRKDAELKQKNAELYALQTQINPHFLHNTLEAIRMRALASGNQDVSRMIYLLSSFFRQSQKGGIITSVSEEVYFCKQYLELMALRYRKNFSSDIQLDSALKECGIIRHVLQPIVENALSHGLDLTNTTGRIEVSIVRDGKDISIQVSDNGKGIPSDKLHQIQNQLNSENIRKEASIGLPNVHQRLQCMFGEDYGVVIKSTPNEITTVSIRIPYLSVKEMEERVQRFDR